MPAPEQVMQVASEWVSKAENDLTNATHTLKLEDKCPTDTVCFHAAQCVEKYLKALLVMRSTAFPKTHDIESLLALVPPGNRPTVSIEEQRRLTAYATAARYPDYPLITLEEARQAVELARGVRDSVRLQLPSGVLPEE